MIENFGLHNCFLLLQLKIDSALLHPAVDGNILKYLPIYKDNILRYTEKRIQQLKDRQSKQRLRDYLDLAKG